MAHTHNLCLKFVEDEGTGALGCGGEDMCQQSFVSLSAAEEEAGAKRLGACIAEPVLCLCFVEQGGNFWAACSSGPVRIWVCADLLVLVTESCSVMWVADAKMNL